MDYVLLFIIALLASAFVPVAAAAAWFTGGIALGALLAAAITGLQSLAGWRA